MSQRGHVSVEDLTEVCDICVCDSNPRPGSSELTGIPQAGWVDIGKRFQPEMASVV